MSVALNWALLRWGMGLIWNRRCYAKQWQPCGASADADEGRAPATLPLWAACVDILRGSVPSSSAEKKRFGWWLHQFGVNCLTARLSAVAWQLCYGLSYHTPGLFGMEVGGNHGQRDHKSWGRKVAGSSATQQVLLWICNMVPQRGRRSTSFSLRRMLAFSPAAIACCQYACNVSVAIPETSV